MLTKDRRRVEVQGSLLAVLVLSVLLAALARRYDVSAPLALVLAGLVASTIPGSPTSSSNQNSSSTSCCRPCSGRPAWRAATSG